MTQLIYKCTKANAEKLGCPALDIMGASFLRQCEFITENGYCSLIIDKKKVVDKLGQLEERERIK